jgi:two-component system, OmpR family, response regulator
MAAEVHAADILLIDDDADVCEAISAVLSRAGYRVHGLSDGQQALQLLGTKMATASNYRVVVCDIHLGQIDGLQILERTRAHTNPPVVIFITGYGSLETAIVALRDGAFDYLLKPFQPSELLACIERATNHYAHMQRQAAAIHSIVAAADQLVQPITAATEREVAPQERTYPADRLLSAGEIVIDRYRHVATFRQQRLHLTPIEYTLLVLLAELQSQVVPYTEIVLRTHQAIVGSTEAQMMLKVHMHNLRRKIDPEYLINVRGVGYMLVVPR